MNGPARAGLTALGWTVVAGGAGTLLAQLFEQPNRAVAAIQAMTPWALLPLTVVACAAAWTDRDRLGFVAALVGLGVVALALPLALTGPGPGPAGDERLTVMSVNVLYSNERIDEVADEVERLAPDVVAFAEVTGDVLTMLRDHPFAERYSHRIEAPADLASGLVLWSRHPVERLELLAGLRRAIVATVDGPIGPTRLVTMHPPPPVFDPAVWRTQIELLPDLAEASDLPTIVLGDFNATWFHPAFRRSVHEAGLRDAATADGRGFAMTWPTDTFLPPLVALDHVLVDDRISVIDTVAPSIPGSDHRAVVATVARSSSG